jgi:hypothetical protein
MRGPVAPLGGVPPVGAAWNDDPVHSDDSGHPEAADLRDPTPAEPFAPADSTDQRVTGPSILAETENRRTAQPPARQSDLGESTNRRDRAPVARPRNHAEPGNLRHLPGPAGRPEPGMPVGSDEAAPVAESPAELHTLATPPARHAAPTGRQDEPTATRPPGTSQEPPQDVEGGPPETTLDLRDFVNAPVHRATAPDPRRGRGAKPPWPRNTRPETGFPINANQRSSPAPGRGLINTAPNAKPGRTDDRRDHPREPASGWGRAPGLQFRPMVHVRDMATSVAFYELLGAEIIHGDPAADHVLLQLGTVQLGLVTDKAAAAAGAVELNFSAAMPLDQLEHRLRNRRVTIAKGMHSTRFGPQVHVRTPDGLVIKIGQLEPERDV